MSRRTAFVLILGVFLISGGVAADDDPLANAVRVSASVDVPLVSDAAWDQASLVSGFYRADGGGAEPADAVTRFRIARTKTHLLLRVRCIEPKMDAVVAKIKTHDGAVYADDGIEIFLMASRTFGRYFHLVANSAGVRYDARFDPASEDVDKKWTCDWTVRVDRDAAGFTYTVSIPLAAIGDVIEGQSWRMNVCRNRPGRGGSAWCSTYGSFHTPRHFGHIRFLAKRTAVLGGHEAINRSPKPLAVKALIECDLAGRRTRHWFSGTLPADGSPRSVFSPAAVADARKALTARPAAGRVAVRLFDAKTMRVLARQIWRPPFRRDRARAAAQ